MMANAVDALLTARGRWQSLVQEEPRQQMRFISLSLLECWTD
jgi:hypothetical protein